VRIGLDATPLLGARTGVGRYAASLLAALDEMAQPDLDLVATAFSLRGRGALQVPDGVRVRSRPVPARLLQAAWSRTSMPPVELLTGAIDVFHATNFVLPPLQWAGGVVTVHDLAFLHRPDTVSRASARYRTLVPRSLRRASVIVTPSRAVAEQVQEAYAPTAEVCVVPHGVDPAWALATPDEQVRAQLGLPREYLLFVGTLEPRKDLRTLLAARALVSGAPPLVLVGPPGWGEQVDVRGCVVTGHLPDPLLRPVVAGAAALVLTSLDEGFGLTVLEALAAGNPVVASDLPVLHEVGGDQVRYAAPGDPEAFAAALTAVLTDPGDAAARRRQAAPFTWRRSAEQHLEAYSLANARQPD